ncbi:MAG TPA: C2 family cysteine protease [Humisphaera sp.]
MKLTPTTARTAAARRPARDALRAPAAAAVEPLEGRQMFSVAVNGTSAADVITIYQNGVSFDVTVNGVTTRTGNQPVNGFTINCLGGDDQVFVSALVTVPCEIYGGDGNDNIKSGRGNDYVDGGNGNDTLRGSDGDDTIRGMKGADTIYAGLGDDNVQGGRGNDYVDGEQGNDFLLGNGMADDGTTYPDNDTIRGGEGNDLVDGMGGDDVVYGDHGFDEVHGGAGNDRVYGGADNDRLMGGPGDDVLVAIGGGTGDLIWGEAGRDSFWLDDARTTELVLDGDAAESAGSAFHFVNQFENNVTYDNGVLLQERPTKELYGQPLRDPMAPEAFANFGKNPLFGANGPRMEDVRQGNVGDCYFLAGLSSIARTNPYRIRDAVVDLGDGTYAVRFANNGVAEYYRVDADLPVSGGVPSYAKLGANNSLWVAIMEKAFAYHRYSDGGKYEWLALGRSEEPFKAIAAPWAEFWGTNGTSLLSQVKQQLDAGRAVVASSVNSSPLGGVAFITQHQYVVTNVDLAAGKITVRNPWGYDGVTNNDGNQSDGLLTFTAAQFAQYFKNVTHAKV